LLSFLYEGSEPLPTGDRKPKGRIPKEKLRLLSRLTAIAETGPPRNVEICHQVDDEIWQVEQGRIRILWFYDEGKIIVLSHGFLKSTPKTPESEKRTAREALKRYKAAKQARTLTVLEDKK
jgi:phage-related protein